MPRRESTAIAIDTQRPDDSVRPPLPFISHSLTLPMESFNFDFNNSNGRPTSAYIRRRLAEATLLQDQHDGSSWQQLDPGPPAVSSVSESFHSLHDELLGNALQHVGRYMDTKTNALAVGEALEAQIDTGRLSSLQDLARNWAADRGPEEQLGALGSSQKDGEGVIMPNEEVAAAETLPFSQRDRDGTINYQDDDGALRSLHGIDMSKLTKTSSLLAMAFEESRSGPQLFLETLSSSTAEPFLRFLNTGYYAGLSEEWNRGGRYEDVPMSVLFHCEMFRLGDIYDIEALRDQAYVNVLRQCEFGCSSPDKPIDLCAGIRFLYAHLRTHARLIDAIINYCVACFLQHRLGEDAEFKQLAYDLRPFHQDLCRNCMDRDFENETAAAIIQMPFEPHRPETYASTEHRSRFDDVVFHFHAGDTVDETDSLPKKRKRENIAQMLPIRSKQEAVAEMKVEPAEEFGDEEFVLARSKRRASSVSQAKVELRGIKSEDEFEEVDLGPAAAESDSDSFEWVDVLPKDLQGAGDESVSLPLRTREQASCPQSGDGESDSDWSLV